MSAEGQHAKSVNPSAKPAFHPCADKFSHGRGPEAWPIHRAVTSALRQRAVPCLRIDTDIQVRKHFRATATVDQNLRGTTIVEWLSQVEWLALAQQSTVERVPRLWQALELSMVEPVLQPPAA